MDYLISRLKEPSTWRGMVMMCTALGLSISPEMTEYIISTGIGVAGVIGALTKDN